MAKFTKAQTVFLKRISRAKGRAFFRRNLKTGKEQCYIGSIRVSSRVFFFFYEIGYLHSEYHTVKRKYEYYDMVVRKYKLDEYLEDYKEPYVIPEQ